MRHALSVVTLLLAAVPAAAQDLPRATISVDGGVAIPLGEFRSDGARTGWAVGATGTVRVLGPLALYASVERTTFGVGDAPAGDVDRWTDTGLGAGLRLWLPQGEGRRWLPWAQLGVGWHDTDPPLADAAFAALDTDGIMTLEGGAGVDLLLAGGRLMLRPALKFRRYGYEIEVDDTTSRASVSSLTLAVGLVVPLGSPAARAP